MKKLHLGCGEKKIKGYINIDIRESVNPDIIDDIGKLNNIENESIDLIYACHVLEHFNRFQYKEVLKRWFEVLKPSGVVKLSVPDIEAVINQYSDNKIPLNKLIGFLYGGQTYPENFHYIGFDFDMLKSDLEEIGFTDIKLWDHRESDHHHIDDYSQAYLPHMDKENGVLMSLNIMGVKK